MASRPRMMLPLAKRVNSTGSANIVKFDQDRARATRQRSQASDATGPAGGSFAVGQAFNDVAISQAVSYVVEVLVGSTPYSLLVDTGSSNTWVGAGKPFVPSASTRPTGDIVSVTYGSGSFTGFEVIENVTLADGLNLPSQSIGVAAQAMGFDGVDGILGVGPQDLTCGTLINNPKKCLSTVTDTAWDLGLLDSYELGISFSPSQYVDQKNGEMTFGGVDRSKFDGDLSYVPLTTVSPASHFVGYDQSIRYGDMGSVLDTAAGILDTGTTLILIASDAFQRYQDFTGAKADDDTGLLSITQEQYGNLQNLYFKIGDIDYALTPDAQIWPRALNADIGGAEDGIYLIVADLQSDSGRGLDFINGMSFLERYYAVYDIANSRIGLAKTHHTDDETNHLDSQ
ncbi:aspartic peptidase A1 [Trametes versicolor FP-101664 SS1]|uniref:aspartic peptidase A1 n=1 Tax=Trametes versicolor (strain FP-101664) TaxID=717944 RepID=UPI0004622C19|nr:aspartic peptidase A1 [Trametes versicolor FP-101664 SS1]EIW53178.1 aspartic peptidase A1 [Trametes versicolor FP-101664 SS1]